MQSPTGNLYKLGYGDYLRFRDLVHNRSGLYFPEKKRTELENGLLKTLTGSALGTANGNLDSYYNLLSDKTNPAGLAEMERLINALTIGETHFFRNQAQFNALALHVLPELINRKRNEAKAVNLQPQLRIWSAGCATGEEPYSLAILLKELLPDMAEWRLLILATDINQQSLTRAQEAVYSDWSFREQRARAIRPRYFTEETAPGGATRYRLHTEIKQMVTFNSFNLIEDNYPAIHNNTVSMDLIMCRNVTIYFTESTTRQVVDRFYQSLTHNGWLVVGHSEPSLEIYRNFETRNLTDTFFYQRVSQPVWELVAETTTLPAPAPSLLPTPVNRQATEQVVDPSPPDPFETAKTLLDQGHAEEAISKLRHILVEKPNFAAGCSLLGRAYANLGQWSEARHWCERALNQDTLQAEAYYVLALVNEHEGQLDQALDMLKKAIYLERDVPLYHFSQAIVYQKSEQPQQARRACQNAIKILEKWPPEAIISDTGGTTARRLLETAHKILGSMNEPGG